MIVSPIQKFTSNTNSDSNHGSQIYTFREQNKNEEYFKHNTKPQINNANEANESNFITGCFSPNESSWISVDKRLSQPDNLNDIVSK